MHTTHAPLALLARTVSDGGVCAIVLAFIFRSPSRRAKSAMRICASASHASYSFGARVRTRAQRRRPETLSAADDVVDDDDNGGGGCGYNDEGRFCNGCVHMYAVFHVHAGGTCGMYTRGMCVCVYVCGWLRKTLL